MISSLHIEGYRGFTSFDMSGLARVNLLVGTNNCGKTSVLEAIYLLASAGDPAALWHFLWRRGERLLPVTLATSDPPGARPQLEVEVSHLFNGHRAQPGASFRISTRNRTPANSIEYSIHEVKVADGEDGSHLGSRVVMHATGSPKPANDAIPLSRAGGMYFNTADTLGWRQRLRQSDSFPTQFITADSVSVNDLVTVWNKVQLTPDESLVVHALQFLEPQVERIAAQATPGDPYSGARSRGGFILKLRGIEQPVPIGSMGDGMWRMLAMAIMLTQCRGGVLLIDEIDSGLHYSIMGQMWKLIFNAAKELDVQVFATTHSSDCVYSLADLRKEVDRENTISVQRIDSSKPHSVPYDEEELSIAAQKEIEVR